MKAAVLTYPQSNNLGDPIQSIAAAQLLAAPVTYLDRDHLHNYKGEAVKLVMNGWFMEMPKHWPPSDAISPLFISFHLNPTAISGMVSPAGIAYFKAHEPIGCRDYHTIEILQKKGVKTYFTGCLTLSLNRERLQLPDSPRKGILVLSVLERMLPELRFMREPTLKNAIDDFIQLFKYPSKWLTYRKAKKKLDAFLNKQRLPIRYQSQIVDVQKYDIPSRRDLALEQLKGIAMAEYVITSRIHSALPAVAFETPVLFLSDGLEHINQSSRLKGLDDFFPIVKTSDLATLSLSQIQPTKAHLPFVAEMEARIRAFFDYKDGINKVPE